ncbi:cobalamin B12-binding domain-containing protein [bacterium]|nr:cobalamin B12-binding domain-containing protein [bacterium]
MDEQGDLTQAMSKLREKEVIALVKQKLDEGVAATEIVAQCREGLAEVGRLFDRGEYYIPELMYAGIVMKKVVDYLGPSLKESPAPDAEGATVVVGTVRSDIHDIGKDIVILMLRGSGFRVIDLGVNTPPAKFVEAVNENNATLVGMSVFLTSCCKSIAETVEAIKEAELRDKVSIMIGGAAASDLVSEKTGCDYYGATAVDAVNYATGLTE